MGAAHASYQWTDICNSAYDRVRVFSKNDLTWLTVYRDMHKMRSKLTELGFDVPRRRYGFGDEPQGRAEDNTETLDHQNNSHARGTSVSLT